MTVWQKLQNEDCYAVAIYNFNSSSAHHLPLEVGELVHVVRETRSWYWGTSVRRAAGGVGAAGSAGGAFPKNYVTVRKSNVDRCGETVVASSGGSGVVHDIAVTLREWLQHWKQLYLTNDERFTFMELSMRALLALRAQAASGALPQDELRRVARTAIFTIDKGNRALGMELAIRTVGGQLVDPLTTSTFKLNGLHDEANSRIDKNMETTPSRPISQTPTARTYTVVGKVTNFVCRVSVTAELSLALHDVTGAKLTESVVLRWPPPHLAAADLHCRPAFVFTDLSSDITKKTFLVCHVVRLGTMDPQNVDHRRSSMCSSGAGTGSAEFTGALRRPCGVAAAEVTLATGHDSKEIQLPFYACDKENMDTLLKKVIANRDPKEQKQSQGLWVDVQLVEGDMKQIRQENPHLVVGPTAVARKMGFPEVILPGDARNDLYVTLVGGSFSRGGKSSDRNVELVARVVDKNGRIIPEVISRGAGAPLANEYTSVVYYHDDRPRWQEVFKVCLNIEEFKEAHMVFLMRHRSSNEAKDRAEKHFALSYLRLMQREGTTTPDTAHNLAVYKIDYKKAGADVEAEASAACLGLMCRRDELPPGADRGLTRGPLALMPRDSLTVATRLCSTKLTQREEILGVLKWSTHHAEGTLRAALRRLLRVPNDELVKFLQDILDALFCILTQVDEEQEQYTEESYAVLVLDCLLLVLSLVADHKYQHFQPVLHVYIDESFCDALAYEKLISIMVWCIRCAEAGEPASKRLLQCMKCLESLARLLVRSRQLRAAMGPRALHPHHYCPQLQSLLEALVWLMRCGDAALTCQGSALKYLPHAAPHLTHVYPDTELCEYIVWALEALPRGRLSNQRLHALLELARGPLGASPGPRAKLLPHLAATLRTLLRAPAELDPEAAQKSRSVDKAARLLGADTSRLLDHTHQLQVMELCVETLGEVVSLLARNDVGPVEADRGELAKSLLPTVLRIAAAMMRDRCKDDSAPQDDPLLRKLVCVLLDMVRQMSEEQYIVVMRSLDAENSRSSGALVNDALALMMALLQRPVFRSYWADMLHLQHYVMLHALRLLAVTLRDNLKSVDESDTEAVGQVTSSFQDWFSTVCAVASSPPLQLETLTAARRQRAGALYGDVRRSAATLLADTWHSLGEHKHLFIPQLVGPFLEVSFLHDEEVRNTTIPLFFDMMQTQYEHNAALGDPNMRSFETELIDKVDVLAEAGRGDAAWRARLVVLCGGACGDAAGGLRATGGALVAAAARQLDALLQYRAAPMPQRVHLVTRVLRFYEHIERPHMYIRYVHRLADMHRAAQQWAEAGLTLQLHARLLDWSDAPLPARLRRPAHRHNTHMQLKVHLYEEAARLLEGGRQWELAARALRELVRVRERRALHAALARLHEQLARLYRAPAPPPATYFRVRYLGKGFPDHLRVPKGFVYRGNECEMLQSFKERMLDEWPDAEVLLKLDEPGEDVTDSDGQYLQINTVSPLMADKWRHLLECGADEQVVRYYEHNDVNVFEFSRPHQRPDDPLNGTVDTAGSNEFASLWLERTEIEISDSLPGILRWFPVVSSRTYWVCPLAVAVETMGRTTRDLRHAVSEAAAPHASLNPLCMRLQGILDAGVQGGLENYERAFLTAEYAARRPDHEALLQRLRDAIVDQLPLLEQGLELHARRTTQRELHAHLVDCFRHMQRHVHQRYGRKKAPADAEVEAEGESPEVHLRTRDSVDLDPLRTALHRASDVSSGNESTPKSKFKLNSAINWTRNSSTGTLTPRKKRGRKSETSSQSSASQWYTSATNGHNNNSNNSFNNSNYSFNNNSFIVSAINSAFNSALNSPVLGNHLNNNPPDNTSTQLRELRQELVRERPLRAEAELSRRLSARASYVTGSEPPSNRDSLGTTDSNQDDEEPPPLPVKQSQRTPDDLEPVTRHSYDLVLAPRSSHLYRRDPAPRAPTPPPKKRHQPSV